MLIDNAAAAFRRIDQQFAVVSSGELGKFTVIEYAGDAPPMIHQEDMHHDDALALRDQLAGRDAVTQVLREMIPPDVLSRAAHKAGCVLQKRENNAVNNGRKPSLALLYGIIATLEEEAKG